MNKGKGIINYVEHYKVPGTSHCSISKEEGGLFQTWSDGSAVGCHHPNIQSARAYLFKYVKDEIARHLSDLNHQITVLTESKEKLGKDPFYLGKFLQEQGSKEDKA